MLNIKRFLITATLVVACGCNQGTPGGPGVQSSGSGVQQQSANKPVLAESRETFTLTPPLMATALKQGESKTASISIQRGTNFDADVQLRFSDIPVGVTLDPATPTLMHDQKDVKVNVTAGDDAAIGNFIIKVNGTSSKGGPDAMSDLKVAVSAK